MLYREEAWRSVWRLCGECLVKKNFNTTGPCNPDKHFILPAQDRCKGLVELIEQEQYFVIHAARQSGKTTLLLDLAEQLNDSGEH